MAEFWSNNDRGYRIRLWIDQTSQDIGGNSSQVRVRVALLNTTTAFAGYTFSGAVTVDGQRLSYSGQPSMTSYNQTISLIDQTITVLHGSDGKKSVGFNASFSGSGGYSPGTLSLSGNFELTTIPRTSSFLGQTVAVGSSMSITINRASSSFTHTLRYGFGSKSGTIATGVATSTSWVVPINFAEEIPNGTSAKGTIWCDTYSGNTKIGTSHYIFTVTVPDTIKPTFSSVTLIDTNGVARGLLTGNNFLQIISNIQVTFNGASGSYGSTITGYKAEIVNRNQVTNSNGGTLGIMDFNGSATIRASVVDSRGRWSDSKDITINVIEYFAPVLSFTAVRTRENPNIIQIVRNAKIAPITLSGSQKNVMTLSFKVAPLGSTTFAADNGSATGTFTTQHTLTNSAANMAGNYPANKSFTVIGTLADKFTSIEFSATVATESVVMSYDKDGRVGIGKAVEQGKAGSLDVAGDIYIGNKILIDIFYPIGSIYQSVNSTNPSIFMGGTWVRFGQGRVLVGVNESEIEFNVANKVGGAKSHTLTIEQIPAHTHTVAGGRIDNYVKVEASSTYGYAHDRTHTTSSVGGGMPHNNLQPYTTVYMWHRTA